ncbi:TPA: hypothetical protein JDC26_004423 [Salmonella enterica subsp. salamae]|nr:hypothetical protein [Salmonella enterica]EDW0469665.1 hypothetical protein [Salmonella enterica subsp. enterica serovar Victoria]ECJ2427910.1 hypothetical protein [Salmonella enterica subsp. salamae]EEP8432948.1 hypothetical protein [Salmonella enterica subsp. salamae]KAA8683523.1 hypothetical protein F4V71_18650 [Salmonella enterica subsp. salamae]HAU3057554.1 hypothetical protein [Salmonella enterica subsp. salamae]
MKFTEDQVTFLKKLSLKNYIDELIDHIKYVFPSLPFSCGANDLYSYIEMNIVRAKNAGYTQRGAVRLYIDMMIIFGVGFERDPLFKNIVTRNINENLSQIEKTMNLYSFLNRYINDVYGEGGVFFMESLNKFKDFNINGISVTYENNFYNIHALLKYIYPQRYEFIGSNAIDHLNAFAEEYVERNKIVQINQKIYLIIVMFLFGCSLEYNPFYNRLNINNLSNYLIKEDSINHDSIVSCYSCLQINCS